MKEINGTKQWEDDVLSSENTVFVDFWAEWCGPCRTVSPILDELSYEYEGRIDFFKVNVDENNHLAAKNNILSIPTLAIFHKGKIVSQVTGAASKDAIKSFIEKNIDKVLSA